MQPELRLKLGNLVVGLSGSNVISQHVYAELLGALPRADTKPDVMFHFVDRLSTSPVAAPIYDNARLAANLLKVGDPMSIEVAPVVGWFDGMVGYDFYRRLRDWNYLTRAETTAKDFIYGVFDWAIQVCQINCGQTYIHASAVKKRDRTLAVVGKGGVGKTTAMLKLCMEQDWRYLSDDLAVIDESGCVYRSPKNLQVYSYNTLGQDELLRRLMGARSALDRLQWLARGRFLGPKQVRRRVSAEALFGASCVARSGLLTDLVFLERSLSDNWAIREMTGEEVAERMVSIVMGEIEPYSQICRRLTNTCSPLRLPLPVEIENATRKVLRRAFSGVSPILLTVGEHATPDKLMDAFRKFLSLEQTNSN